MSKCLSNSLPNRAWYAAFIVTLLLVLSSISSGFLAWIAKEDAQAINVAGSMRMATYRLNFLLASDSVSLDTLMLNELGSNALSNETDNTKKRILANHLIKDMKRRHAFLNQYQDKYKNKNTDIDYQLSSINTQWHQQLEPLLLNLDSPQFYQHSLTYLKKVDTLVSELQYRNEARQAYQQQLQLFILFITILIMWFGLRELRRNVLIPVKNLVNAKKKFRSGALGTRIDIEGYSEFRELGNSFNAMADTIQTNHNHLEHEIATKTAHLTQANQVLTLLYDFSKRLAKNQISISELNSLIVKFSEIIPELELTLCIQSDTVNNDKDAISLHSRELKELCSTTTCEQCLIKNNQHTKSFPIHHNKTQYGDLRVRPKNLGISRRLASKDIPVIHHNQDACETNQIPLIEEPVIYTPDDIKMADLVIANNNDAIHALANFIATAMYLLQQRQQEHQIILLEERATIARELHDSLAQSLSYLKIQVSILEKQLINHHCTSPEFDNLTTSITKIKDGLTSAYQHLRDLLVTFRLSLNDDSFDEALHNSAEEFSEKGGFNIHVINQVISLNLSATEQVNIIQITREALSNICRHADATQVNISFKYVPNSNDTILRISDNGAGISHDFDQTHHHGIMIMQQRAQSLGGTFKIAENVPNGTMVEVRFSPEFFNESSS
ncbi:histidine kinase [Psychrobacter sp. FDAARGOS_221]|uniref:histidine kinase n=1 Tax=Psychrobacter sp. FDAARGOS_221 TaxID=1975705 RepID=UPI000C9F083F|nr:histidine kinase [Psychrobacter sp. FDAARGOS_221]PNK60087.1 nitrate/nitrite two-component system sensor histidine kinase [Psychrobacter sp. FDAARGOS_221]